MRSNMMLMIVFISIALISAGCVGGRETEELAYVIAIGIDKAEQPGMIQVTYEIATPQGREGEKGSDKKSATISINDVTSLAEARNLLNSVIAPVPTLSHIKLLVVGEEIAMRGIGDTLGALVRFREYRGSMYVVVARGTAKNFLEKNKPIFSISPSKYYELAMSSGDETGYYLHTSLHQFYLRIKSGSAQPYAMLVGINPRSGQGQSKDTKIPGDKTREYSAGDIGREGGNPLEYLGTAVFVDEKMVGTLTSVESRLLAILLGDFPYGFITVEDPLMTKKGVNVAIHLGNSPKIKANLVDGRAVINADVLLEGEISSIASGINYEENDYLTLLEGQISQIFEERMVNFIKRTQDMNADIVGFGYYLRPCFKSHHEFETYKWNGKYNQAEVTVKVKTKIRRNGLMNKTAPTR